MERNGGCACGAVRYRIDGPVLGVGACHCSDCRRFSGGDANYVALVPVPALTITQGVPAIFHTRGDSGADVGRAFCAGCGAPLWSVPAHEPFITVKLGSLDDGSDLTPQMHIYTSSALSREIIPDDLPSFATMPPPLPADR